MIGYFFYIYTNFHIILIENNKKSMKKKEINENKDELLKFALVNNSTGEDYISTFDTKYSGAKYVRWGSDNKMPIYLYDNYLKNSNLQAVINTIVNYVFGEGTNTTPFVDDLIEKLINDYIIFGGFAIECIRSRSGDIVQYNYVDVMNVRVNEELDTAFLSSKWSTYSGKDIVELPLYNPNEQQPHFIYYYRGKITRNINPLPMYIGAYKSVEILNSTRNFHLNNVNNNFSVSAIINLNNGNIKSKELEEIKERLEKNFAGANNAGKFMLINSPDREHAATVQKLNADNFGDLYQALDKSSKEDIYTAFRINPMLIGINQQTGFQKQEFEDAYNLFYTTVIRPIQNTFKKCFAQIGLGIDFLPFKISWSE